MEIQSSLKSGGIKQCNECAPSSTVRHMEQCLIKGAVIVSVIVLITSVSFVSSVSSSLLWARCWGLGGDKNMIAALEGGPPGGLTSPAPGVHSPYFRLKKMTPLV